MPTTGPKAAIAPAPTALTLKERTSRIAPSLLASKEPTTAVILFDGAPGIAGGTAASMLAKAETMPRGAARKELVFSALNSITSAARATALPGLEELQKSGKVAGVDTLWSANAVRVRGVDAETLQSLVGPNVTAVVPDEIIANALLPNGYTDALGAAKATQPEDPNTTYIDWGVKKMNAPAAWAQGITGAGITVASLDTGVITDHPGLKKQYRGTKPDGTQDHNYNWLNAVENGGTYPIDDVGHGTHTIGNAVGGDDKHLIGVAPDAQFIAGRGLGNAGGTLFGLIKGMEWMMAPTDLAGKNARPDLAPDIVTNSWGGAPVSNPLLWMELRNWRRSGILPVFAAGNTGGKTGAGVASVVSPGLYSETITVGATNKDDSRAYFSDRGPSNYSGDVKPEVTAPGVKMYSAWVDGSFKDTFTIDGKEYPASGTSMATPHVAGAMALYMQAHPNASYDELLGALETSGTDPQNKNEDTGYGRVQVDKLITSVDKDAKLAPKERIDALMKAAAEAKVYGE